MKVSSSAVFDGQSFEGARTRLIAFTAYTVIALVTAMGGSLVTFGFSYDNLGYGMIAVCLGYLAINWLIFIPMVVSGNYGVAFLGHLCVAFTSGLFIGPFLAANAGVLPEALASTGAVTVGMCAAGMLYPRFFAGIGRYLVTLLFLFIFWMIGSMLLQGVFGITFSNQYTSWIGIGLFSMFIGHHVGMVVSNDLSPAEVISESCGAFLSIINLLLHMIGARSRD